MGRKKCKENRGTPCLPGTSYQPIFFLATTFEKFFKTGVDAWRFPKQIQIQHLSVYLLWPKVQVLWKFYQDWSESFCACLVSTRRYHVHTDEHYFEPLFRGSWDMKRIFLSKSLYLFYTITTLSHYKLYGWEN